MPYFVVFVVFILEPDAERVSFYRVVEDIKVSAGMIKTSVLVSEMLHRNTSRGSTTRANAPHNRGNFGEEDTKAFDGIRCKVEDVRCLDLVQG